MADTTDAVVDDVPDEQPVDGTQSEDGAQSEDRAQSEDGAQSEDRAEAVTPSRMSRWWHVYLHRISYSGLVVGMIFLWLSVTPSLLPRGALFQGIVGGGAAAVGYCVGAFLAWLGRYLMSRDVRWPSPPLPYWLGLAGVFVVGTAVTVYWFGVWQNELRDLMGVERLTWTAYPVIAVVAVIIFVVLMIIGQAWFSMLRWLVGRIVKIAPPRISLVAGVTVMVVLSVVILNGVVADYSMRWLNATFAAANEETTTTEPPPETGLRSGGPGSLVSYASLGREGRTFVSEGPGVSDLEAFNGAPAMQPIRAYVGLGSGADLHANADLAADELVRAGGLDRAVVAIGSATGSGWLNKATVSSLEYMYNGDVATVSMQYSYLPSWISFIVDRERARQAGSALFEAVDAKVRQLPENQRPKIVVFGESLGSFGAEAAFGTVPTMSARTDGALLVGPTFNNSLWNDATNERDPGSPQSLPIYDDGRQVRFIADQGDLGRPEGQPWPGPRIVYLQHASDPIAWWSPQLILNRPDWLAEPRGRDVLPAMRWIPIITFLQTAADMAVSVNVPDGHGHNYLSAIPYAWADILRPPGWTTEKTERLVPLLHRD